MSGREIREESLHGEINIKILRIDEIAGFLLTIMLLYRRLQYLFFDYCRVDISSSINRGALPDWDNRFITRLSE